MASLSYTILWILTTSTKLATGTPLCKRMVTQNCGPSVVIIEENIQDLEVQQEEACKAASKACFSASKVNCNRPVSPSWQTAPVATSPHNTSPFFKPANLPRFDRKINVAMFLWLYQNSIYGADKAMTDAIIIKFLDTNTQMLILSCLPESNWTYAKISQALTKYFGSQKSLLGQEMNFADTKLKVGKTLEDFTSRFYLKGQTLASMKVLKFIDVNSALLNAVWVNRELSLALKSGIYILPRQSMT
ncbi:hypothetical protein DSO57_1013437 [Entomophthora muscae]|uniref:Uncharacterized protein n=1 Tax=Entomophthora muscae TaxID=34485 RepID=A0ACC2TTH0_9FUNG|nr:hypothetical protein DSO57_1013437 [Entomophthora muscae]